MHAKLYGCLPILGLLTDNLPVATSEISELVRVTLTYVRLLYCITGKNRNTLLEHGAVYIQCAKQTDVKRGRPPVVHPSEPEGAVAVAAPVAVPVFQA